MYLPIEDGRPETPTLESAISRREAVLLSVALHLVAGWLILALPRLPFIQQLEAERARRLQAAAELARERQREATRFVFVQPRVDLEAPRPPERADASDKDRMARTVERPPTPTNPLPFARGNSRERVESPPMARAAGPGRDDEVGRGERSPRGAAEPAEAARADGGLAPLVAPSLPRAGLDGGAPRGRGALGDALRNLQRYLDQQQFDNPQGGAAEFGPWIQFDTKGVEFGPWIRRFVAQIKRNWFIPYAAMSLKGHVVITFYVHKDGAITDLAVVKPSAVDAFNNAAYNALLWSNPTQPLPPEYPADKAFFTVTFFYNETPPTP
jgi:TonB family protein